MKSISENLGRYLLIDKIASGGMADIFKAKLVGVDGFEKLVAIKKILPHWSQNTDFTSMLVDEAKILVQLNHPNIVHVFELNREKNQYYIVMEYVDGVDLRYLLQSLENQRTAFPWEIALRILAEIAQGLAYAHNKKGPDGEMGLIHRDISPQNILLSREGQIKITDFGIAKVLGKSTETVTGVLKGKFSYMSPEQALGKKMDSRSDLFSLGILFYEMLFVTRLFRGKNDLETLEAVKLAPILIPETKLPNEVIQICLKLLERDVDQRFQSASDLISEISKIEARYNLKTSPEHVCHFLNKNLGDFLEKKKREDEISEKITLDKNKKYFDETRLYENTALLEETRVDDKVPLVHPSQELIPLKKVALQKEKSKKTYYFIIIFLIIGLIGIFTLKRGKKPDPLSEKMPVSKPDISLKIEPGTLHHLAIKISKSGSPKNEETNISIDEKLPSKETEPTLQKHEKRFGFITVTAKPWGMVSISGIGSQETPIQKKKIPEGSYTITITHQSKKVSQKIKVSENKIIWCKAVFGENSRMSCE